MSRSTRLLSAKSRKPRSPPRRPGAAPSPAMSQACRKSSPPRRANLSHSGPAPTGASRNHGGLPPLQGKGDSCDRTGLTLLVPAAFMRILLLGSGGREHALAWKIAASPLVTKLWCGAGNAGIAREAECVALNIADHVAVLDFCRSNAVDFVVVGPDAPIAAGIVDDLAAAGFKAFGPSKAAARLESSKKFTKALCRANNIPTAAYEHFTDANQAKAYIRAQGAPIVVKADGLAAGKGVVVAMTEGEALAAVDMMFGGGLGEAGAEVVLEQFMEGEEGSFFALCDGEHALPLATAQDHKR